MSSLPIPDQDAMQYSHALVDYIIKEMKGNSLSFSDFMQLSLYAPGLGYYVAGSEKFGAEGDFVTAPMISPLFAATLAQFVTERIHGPIHILELGAGNGLLARGLLEAFALTGRECTYYILELSPDCQARQREALVEY